jgi:hypothetical protein
VYKPQLSKQQAAIFNPQIIAVNQSLEKRSLKPTRTIDQGQQQQHSEVKINHVQTEALIKNRQGH